MIESTASEKEKCQQLGQVQCQIWKCWFHSKGGLAVHRCSELIKPQTLTLSSLFSAVSVTELLADLVILKAINAWIRDLSQLMNNVEQFNVNIVNVG